MNDLLQRCMGLDVHKNTIVACLLIGETDTKPQSEIRTFSTLRHELLALRSWIEEANCQYVAMESTGIYWQAVYETLEDCCDSQIQLLVVNARHMKNVPGRKTDMRDAEWIANLLRAGLLKNSFIPTREIRELRDLTRYRKSIVHEITNQKNRVEKFLQRSGFRLSSFMSDVFGVSGRNILTYLVKHGSIDRIALDGCLKTQTRNRMDEILMAVNGTLSPHQRQYLQMMLSHLDMIQSHLLEVMASIEKAVEQFTDAMTLLCSIPGISTTAAAAILAEIGTDMSCFPNAQQISSWAGLAPGNYESAGKRKRVSINKGNAYLKSMLCEVAWVLSGKRQTYFSGWYWRVKQQRGAKRAVIALAHKLLVVIYTMLSRGCLFDETVFDKRKQLSVQRRANRYIHELTRLGYTVESPA